MNVEEKRLQGDENRKEEKDKQSYDCVIDALRIARLYYSKSIPGDVDPCRSFRGEINGPERAGLQPYSPHTFYVPDYFHITDTES